jgi:hypothetical protein
MGLAGQGDQARYRRRRHASERKERDAGLRIGLVLAPPWEEIGPVLEIPD